MLAHRYTDMESEDYPFYQGLVYLLENNVSTLGYDLPFSTEARIRFYLYIHAPHPHPKLFSTFIVAILIC